jgi:WD40 repeat protein
MSGPFPGLRAFDEEDAERLFARDEWTEIIIANLVASRLTVLYGESGVGKTSLLQAGVEADLRRGGRGARSRFSVVPVVFRDWKRDPVAGLIGRLRHMAPDDGSREARGGADLGAALREGAAGGDSIALILDQFEEYLLYHDDVDDAGGLPTQLARIVAEPGVPVTVLISIREDALFRLDRLTRRIPHLFDNMLHLDPVRRGPAREAITGPIAWHNGRLEEGAEPMLIEDDLVEAVLDEVNPERTTSVVGGRGQVSRDVATTAAEAPVELAFLQLVMSHVWDRAVALGSHRLGVDSLPAGGAAQIVRNHVNRATDGLSFEQQDIAAAIFSYLVTPSGSKIAYRTSDLARITEREPEELAPLLDALSGPEARILRSVGFPAGRRDDAEGTELVDEGVEIYHDKLAEPVLDWRARHLQAVARRRAAAEAREAVHKRNRRLGLIAGFGLLLAVAAATTVLLLVARRERRIANSRELAAAAVTQLATDPELSVSLAMRGAQTQSTPQATDALRTALIESHVRQRLSGGGAGVIRVAYAQDGRKVVTAAKDGTITVWDDRTGRRTGPTLRMPPGAGLSDLAVSPAGDRVVAVAKEGGRVWALKGGPPATIPSRRGGNILAVAFSPDGRRIATASLGGAMRVWTASEHPRAVREDADPAPLRSVAFSPDGSRVVTAGDRGATIWRADPGPRAPPVRRLGTTRAFGASFSPDGKVVATGAEDGTAALWSARTGRRLHVLRGHDGPVTLTAFAPDGRTVATGARDRTVRLWNVATGRVKAILSGHTGAITGIAFSSDGEQVATGSQDGTARTWQASTGELRLDLRGHAAPVVALAFRPRGGKLATASLDGTARVWDTTPRLPATGAPGPTGAWRDSAFTDGGSTVASVAADGSMTVARTADGRVQRRWRPTPSPPAGASIEGTRASLRLADGTVRVVDADRGRTVAVRPSTPVRSAALVAAATELATIEKGQVELWDARSGVRISRLVDRQASASGVAVTPAGAQAVTISHSGVATLWDARSGRRIRSLPARGGQPLDRVAIDGRGTLAAVAGTDGTVRTYHLPAGTFAAPLIGHLRPVTAMAFSPEGSLLATASRDGSARVWDAATGRGLAVLRGGSEPVETASFSPDSENRFLLSTTRDGAVQLWLWDVGGGALAAELPPTSGPLAAAAFDPSGRRILVTPATGSARVFACDVCGDEQRLLQLARARHPRPLSPAERQTFDAGG